MKLDKINPYVRLQLYYTWLVNNYDQTAIDDSYKLGIPIRRPYEITGIPLSVIREDFLCMFQWQNSIALTMAADKNCNMIKQDNILEFDDSCEQYKVLDNLYHLDKLYNQLMEDKFPEELGSLLLNSTLDELPIYMDNQKAEAVYNIPISSETAAALLSFQSGESKFSDTYNRLNRKYQNIYHIKDSYLYTHNYNALNEKLDMIHRAINEDRCLQMKYKTSQNKIIDIFFHPLKVSYDADENLYSVISIYKEELRVHRLDRILSLDFSEKSVYKIEKQDLGLLDITPNVWGNFFSGKPEYVKIRFYNEANVWEKVKKELANRINGKLYEEEGFLYYEDLVYGISRLRSWVYGYSSSAVVLEPESLRQQIIESLKIRKERE